MPNLSDFSVRERLVLIQDLWDSIAADTGNVPVESAHLLETRRRLAAYRADGVRGELARGAAEKVRNAL